MRIFGYLLSKSCILEIISCILKDFVQTCLNDRPFANLQVDTDFSSKSRIVLLITGFAIDFLTEQTHNKNRKIY